MNRTYAAVGVVFASLAAALTAPACSSSHDKLESTAAVAQAVGPASSSEVALDPTTVAKFAQPLPIPEVWTGTPVTQNGKVVQQNYNLSVVQTTQQMLPPGMPATTVLAYRGSAHPKGSNTSSTITVTPGAVFENTVGIPSQVTFVDNIQQPAFLEVDPTFHWANPLAMQVPVPGNVCVPPDDTTNCFPFNLFPPGYEDSLFPVAHVTHTHGLAVLPQFDGTAEEWFTPNFTYKGPSFVSNVYLQPNQQSPTQLFYHDHVMGETRIGLYSGVIGTADFIRDPAHNPLDAPSSPLPQGQFEIPLALSARRFYTDGNVDFPPDRGSLNSNEPGTQGANDSPPNQPYWSYNEGADEILVNGAVWPNLDVQPRQYRFRMVAGANAQLFDLQLCVGDWNANQTDAGTNNLITLNTPDPTNPDRETTASCTGGTIVPFTIIGSDGGYLPAPQPANDVQIGITERADILVDFSQFAPGTKITMMNARHITTNTTGTTEVVMQFTVQNGTPVPPPTLSASLFPPRPVLTPNAPTRTKVFWTDTADDPLSRTFDKRSIDGLDFDSPPTELPLVGSTEEWDLVNIFPVTPDISADSDKNTHQVHIHLLEFQLKDRQNFDCAHYAEQWTRLNGHNPVTSPITLDPAPFLIGNALHFGDTAPGAPTAVETGWKDTIEAPTCMITRILVRWAPQSTPTDGVQPGQNQFPFDPTSFPDNVAGPGYVWHCHLVGHEDHDMMRELVVVNAWAPGVNYKVGTVVAFNNADFRVTTAHTSVAGQPPTSRFDLWDRVNNDTSTCTTCTPGMVGNGGQWTPQVRYALNDRVLFQGNLFSARSVFQAQTGQTPPGNPSLWTALPNDACGQLAQFCQNPNPARPLEQTCLSTGQAGNDPASENTCLGMLDQGGRGNGDLRGPDGGVITPVPGMSECLSDCLETVLATPCSGLCNNPTVFSVAGNSNFQSGNLGTGATCFETESRLLGGEDTGFVSPRQITVNGRVQVLNGDWNQPLPPIRNNGYCIQTTAGQNPWAAFSVWTGPAAE